MNDLSGKKGEKIPPHLLAAHTRVRPHGEPLKKSTKFDLCDHPHMDLTERKAEWFPSSNGESFDAIPSP
jgi:hypothetical protein